MANPPPRGPQTNLQAMWYRHQNVWAIVCTIILTLCTFPCARQMMEYSYIRSTYGQQAWKEGIRILNKQGDLSNGDRMSLRSQFLVFVPAFLITAAVFLTTPLSLAYLNMRRRHERLSEQLARYRQERLS